MNKNNYIKSLLIALMLLLGTTVGINAQMDKATWPTYNAAATTVLVTGITLDLSTLTFPVGYIEDLKATVLPATATNKAIVWTTDNPAIATVSQAGIVKGESVGVTTITATTVDGGYTASCVVTIGPLLTGEIITMTTTAPSIDISVAYVGEGKIIASDGTVLPNIPFITVYPDGNGVVTLTATAPGVVVTEIDFPHNSLTTLDVSKCINLNYLNCYNNNLTKLDVSKCTYLFSLNCFFNQLTSLDVTACPNMGTLQCNNNLLTELKVAGRSRMFFLYCNYNNLTELDLTGCTSLETLECGTNKLTTIDVSDNPLLKMLNCRENVLSEVDLQPCPDLRHFDCSGNTITTLDLSKSPLLTELYADDQRISLSPTGTNHLNPIKYTLLSGAEESIEMKGINYRYGDRLPVDGLFMTTLPVATGLPFSGIITFTSSVPTSGVTISNTTLTLNVGHAATLTATVTPATATDKTVVWTSSNASVATVSASGVVTAVAEGSATITVTTSDGAKTATCTVIVIKGDVGLEPVGNNTFTAYPNPTTGAVTITGLTPGAALRIYTSFGSLVATFRADDTKTTIDLSAFAAGIYYINTDKQTLKVIKK